MRKIFIVLAKLAGLFQLYQGINYVAALVTSFSQMSQLKLPGAPPSGSIPIQIILPIIGFGALTLIMAYILMFRTNWLANILGIKEEHDTKKLTTSLVLQAGVKLIGVYIAANAIPEVYKSLVEWIMTCKQYTSDGMSDKLYASIFRTAIAKGFISTILPSILELCIGLFAAMKTEIIILYIKKDEKA